MFKKITAILLTVIIFISFSGFSFNKKKEEVDISTPEARIAQSVLQYPATNEDFRYDIYTYYVIIKECLSTKSNIIIPDTIQDLPVYKIAPNAFSSQTAVTSVTMTNNIIEIGERAFANCTNLQSINISKNLTLCGASVFSDCDNLKTVTIPGGLSVIPSSMFSNCDRLSTVIIEESGNNIVSDDGNNTSVVSRIIEGSAFGDCPMLKNVWIPMDITEINENTFYNSTENLTIYGQAQSIAAHHASEKLINFTVLDKTQFKNIVANATAVELKGFQDTIESDYYKITLQSVFTFRNGFKYLSGEKKTSKKLNTSNEIIVIGFSVKNISSQKRYFNILDTKITVDSYGRKISSFGQIDSPYFSMYNQPLVGNIESGDTLYGYIAVETTADWKKTTVQFMNDTTLEEYAFEIQCESKNVHRIGALEIPAEEVEEETTVSSEQKTTAKAEETTVTPKGNNKQNQSASKS